MTNDDGRGFINILNAKRLINSPLLYSTFLLWMLSELFEKLPEEGDMDIPKMVFFFDEAHLLFNDAPKPLLDKVTQIVKLIRSKGVGIYFISQSPADIPDAVLSQLQNRVQHALHAYTPAEQKAVKVAAQTFRANKDFSTEEAISTLGVGEALISFLDEDGVPSIVKRGKILPPQGLMAPADSQVVEAIISESELEELYRESFDRESAYEMLENIRQEDETNKKLAELEAQIKQEEAAREKAAQKAAEQLEKQIERENKAHLKEMEKAAAAKIKAEQKAALAEQKAAEKAAADAERERRKREAELMRELNKAVKSITKPGTAKSSSSRSTASKSSTAKSTSSRSTASKSSTKSSSSRSTTSKNSTSKSSTTHKTGTSYGYPTAEQQLTDFGIEVGKSIIRGFFGNRI